MSTRDVARRIQRRGIPEELADSLRERILSGEFEGGQALIQDSIAREYDTSRMPVREALRQLEADGLVEMRLHRGAVVTSLSPEEIQELFELRALLECDALRRAIPQLGDAELDASRQVLKRLESAYRRRDIASWGQLNWEFHGSLYSCAGRPQTIATLQTLNLKIDRYIRVHLLITGELERAEGEHRKLLKLCAQRDTHRAVGFLEEHILTTGHALIQALVASPKKRRG